MIKISRKEVEILSQILSAGKPVPLLELITAHRLSERNLKANLQYIADFLKQKQLHEGFVITAKSAAVTHYHSEITTAIERLSKSEYYLAKDERVECIYFQYIAGFGMTLDELADYLEVSKTTVKSCLPFVKNMIRAYDLEMEYITKTGLSVSGRECEIRKALLEFLYFNCKIVRQANRQNRLELNNINPYLHDLISRLLTPERLQKSAEVLAALKHQIPIDNDEIYCIEVFLLAIISFRSDSGNLIEPDARPRVSRQANPLLKLLAEGFKSKWGTQLNLREFDDAIIMLNQGYLACDSEETQYQLIGAQVVIQRTVSQIINRNIDSSLEIPPMLNTEIEHALSMLYSHIYKAVERIRTGVKIQNPFLGDIRASYHELFVHIKEELVLLEEFLGSEFPDDEVGYMVLLIENLLSAISRTARHIKHVILVCGAGYGTSQIVKEKIERLFDVKIKKIIPVYRLEASLDEEDAELFISTVPVHLTGKKTIIEVSPLITAVDIEKLKKAGMKELTVDVDAILETIDQYCTINNRRELERKLKDILNVSERKPNKYQRLLSIIHKDVIALNQEAASWQEAIRLAGGLLYRNGNIDRSYIDDMIDNVIRYGSYITLGKGVALPHARNRGNVHSIGFSIVTLASPVRFDNGKDVDVIICFCSKNRGEYEEALMALMELIEYHDILNYKNTIKTPQQLITFIENIMMTQ